MEAVSEVLRGWIKSFARNGFSLCFAEFAWEAFFFLLAIRVELHADELMIGD